MGNEWDDDKGGRQQWVAWLASILAECRRIMKPGAMGWVWALPRTSHWTATACEDAGLIVRDIKDAAFAASELRETFLGSLTADQFGMLERLVEAAQPSMMSHWFGTGMPKSKALLKPAVEHWILVRAPGELRELRIDENRIGISKDDLAIMTGRSGSSTDSRVYGAGIGQQGVWVPNSSGRWPANVALAHGPGCRVTGMREVASNGRKDKGSGMGYQGGDEERGAFGTTDPETVDQYECQPNCPVRALDEQAGVRKSGKLKAGVRKGMGYGGSAPDNNPAYEANAGAASRFFYTAKPSQSERNEGCEDLRWAALDPPQLVTSDQHAYLQALEGFCSYLKGKRLRFTAEGNIHPTVKPVALIRHLLRLICKPGDVVLDPFVGSGTHGVAATREGLSFIGCDLDPGHVEIARRRIAYAVSKL